VESNRPARKSSPSASPPAPFSILTYHLLHLPQNKKAMVKIHSLFDFFSLDETEIKKAMGDIGATHGLYFQFKQLPWRWAGLRLIFLPAPPIASFVS